MSTITDRDELQWEIVPRNIAAATEVIDFIVQSYEGIYLKKGEPVEDTLIKKHLEEGATTFAIRFQGSLVGTMTLFEGPRNDFSTHRYSVRDADLDELGRNGSIEKVGDFATIRPDSLVALEKRLGCKVPEKKIPLLLMQLAFYHTLKQGIRYACLNVREKHATTYAKGFGFSKIGKPHTTSMQGASIPTTEVFLVLDFNQVRVLKENGGEMSFLMKIVLQDPPPETPSL